MSEATIHSLYSGEIELKFTAGNHQYRVREKGTEKWNHVESVTTIQGMLSKPALVRWAARMCGEFILREKLDLLECIVGGEIAISRLEEFSARMVNEYATVRDEAGDIGKIVHDYAEAWGKWAMDSTNHRPGRPTDPQARQGVEAFHEFLSEHHVKFLELERKVYSRKHHYTGTCDLVADIDGTRTLGDYKTGKGYYADTGIQLAAYKYAWEEENGQTLDSAVGLHFDKETGVFTPHWHTGHADFDAFHSCHALYKWDRANKAEYAKRKRAAS